MKRDGVAQNRGAQAQIRLLIEGFGAFLQDS